MSRGSLPDPLDVLAEHERRACDALVIIRGGGAAVDLWWLNDLELGRTLCNAPLPCFTGIGHERDSTILGSAVSPHPDPLGDLTAFGRTSGRAPLQHGLPRDPCPTPPGRAVWVVVPDNGCSL
jgi:hypothetical protein